MEPTLSLWQIYAVSSTDTRVDQCDVSSLREFDCVWLESVTVSDAALLNHTSSYQDDTSCLLPFSIPKVFRWNLIAFCNDGGWAWLRCVCVWNIKQVAHRNRIRLLFLWHNPGLFRSLKLLSNSLPRPQAETCSGGYITQLNMTTWAYRLYTFPATSCRILEADWLSSFQQGINPPPLPNTVTISLIYQSRSLATDF